MIANWGIIDGVTSMPQYTIFTSNKVNYVYSWTTGAVPCTNSTRFTEDDVMARALWLVRNGRDAEADALLEKYCSSAPNKA